MYNRIALYNNYESWDDMVESAKNIDTPFELPPYMLMPKSEKFIDTELLPTIKQMNFKLVEIDGKLYLTRDLDAKISTEIVEEDKLEDNDENIVSE